MNVIFFFHLESNVMSTARSSLNIINFIVGQILECNFAPQILHCDERYDDTFTHTHTQTHDSRQSTRQKDGSDFDDTMQFASFNETRLLFAVSSCFRAHTLTLTDGDHFLRKWQNVNIKYNFAYICVCWSEWVVCTSVQLFMRPLCIALHTPNIMFAEIFMPNNERLYRRIFAFFSSSSFCCWIFWCQVCRGK